MCVLYLLRLFYFVVSQFQIDKLGSLRGGDIDVERVRGRHVQTVLNNFKQPHVLLNSVGAHYRQQVV